MSPSDDRIKIMSWTEQPAVLSQPAVKMFVSHCGVNSVNDALVAGKPVLALPFGMELWMHVGCLHKYLQGIIPV